MVIVKWKDRTRKFYKIQNFSGGHFRLPIGNSCIPIGTCSIGDKGHALLFPGYEFMISFMRLLLKISVTILVVVNGSCNG